MRNFFFLLLKAIASPTYLIADIIKKNEQNLNSETVRAELIKKFNWNYFCISLCIVAYLYTFSFWYSNFPRVSLGLLIIIGYYVLSRVNEVFLAFLRDAKDKMDKRPEYIGGLRYSQRLMLALRSYLELIIDYGILYFLVNTYYFELIFFNGKELINQDFGNIFEAIYFSASTITTLGYGDFSPVHNFSQFLCIYEVLNGFLLIVVSFAIYVSLNFYDGYLPQRKRRKSVSEKRQMTDKVLVTLVLFIFIVVDCYIVYSWNNTEEILPVIVGNHGNLVNQYVGFGESSHTYIEYMLVSTAGNYLKVDWISYFLNGLGVFVTAIFSYLIWQATKKSNQIAELSFTLSKQLKERGEKNFKETSHSFKSMILLRMKTIVGIFEDGDSHDVVYKRITNPTITSFNLSEEELAKYFTENEQKFVLNFWNLLNKYIDICWKKGDRYKYPDEIESMSKAYSKWDDEFCPKLQNIITSLEMENSD